jgi:hypothetical protein
MICPNCGKQIPSHGKVCPYCWFDKRNAAERQEGMIYGLIGGIAVGFAIGICFSGFAALALGVVGGVIGAAIPAATMSDQPDKPTPVQKFQVGRNAHPGPRQPAANSRDSLPLPPEPDADDILGWLGPPEKKQERLQ